MGGKSIMHVRAHWKIWKPSGLCRARRIHPLRSLLITLGYVIFVVLFAAEASLAQASQPKAPDYSANPKWFPHVLSSYKQRQISPADLTNSKTLSQMIRDGKIELSLEIGRAHV